MKLEGVVLAAGPGSRMVELSRGRPKCLLPVGNHSLIWFAITGLRMVGVTRIIILVSDIYEQDIKQYCNKKFNAYRDLVLEFVTVPIKADCGTAESILEIRDKIREDFIVYSCDTIVDPDALSALLNHYRLYDPMLSMLLSDNANYFRLRSVPGRREKERFTRDIIAIEPLDKLKLTASDKISANKVVFLHSERDLGKNLRIKNRKLALHPSLEVCSRFLDTHVYIFKRQALDFMAQNKDRAVLKGEMIPLLISKQYSKSNDDTLEDDYDVISGSKKESDYEIELKEKLENFNPKNVTQSNYPRKLNPPRPSACHALVVKNLRASRVNTIGSYLDCNRDAVSILNTFGMTDIKTVSGSVVGEEFKLGKSCTIKGFSIGNNCKIGDNVKLFGCVVMDNVEIESGAKLTDCIIGSHSRIESDCDLKSCIVGFKQKVLKGRKANSEVIIDDEYVIDLSNPLDNDND